MTDVAEGMSREGKLGSILSAFGRGRGADDGDEAASGGLLRGLFKRGEKRTENDFSIAFDGVSKYYQTKSKKKWILRDVSFRLPRGRSMAVLGKNGTGKSTMMRLFAGVEPPSQGDITRGVRVSWPLGFSGCFSSAMSARENCTFIARIYNVDIDQVAAFVEDFSELGNYFDMPAKTYSSGMRARLAFGLSMAIDFDCYLIDEITAVGDHRFQEKCREAFAERRKKSDVIMISHHEATIKAYCDVAAVLNNGRMHFYEDIDEAMRVYGEL